MRFNTALLHQVEKGDKETGATLTPIYHSSAFYQSSAEQHEKLFHNKANGFSYTRINNPTILAFENEMTALEGGIASVACASGMAAITNALLNVVRAGEEILASTSLYGGSIDVFHDFEAFGIKTVFVDIHDEQAVEAAINEKTKLITIQRSKGYATRPTFSVAQIGELIAFCKQCKPDVTVMVDNCYGEFVETMEPSDVGADMIVGSLIKNPGGGLAPIGGYICGTAKCVSRCAYRLSAPGLGQEVGANLGLMKDLFQGFFLAPTVTAGAEKGAVFAANLYEPLGFKCVPNATESRHDIIQAVELGSEKAMIAFCKGIQEAAPVDSFATPLPWDMPGYDDQVIMAAGAFVQGSSIELSADGPIREPYAVYFQGGLTWYHAKLGILMSLQEMVNAGLVTL